MNTKEIKITVPEGYEIDKENSTFECIKFKKKGLTYEDIAEKLFTDRVAYFIGDGATIDSYIPSVDDETHLANQATSKKQLQRLLAINKLMNVAEYLNDGWKPQWEDTHKSKWYIYWNHHLKKFEIDSRPSFQSEIAHFKTPDLALQAIAILGEEEVKLALGV